MSQCRVAASSQGVNRVRKVGIQQSWASCFFIKKKRTAVTNSWAPPKYLSAASLELFHASKSVCLWKTMPTSCKDSSLVIYLKETRSILFKYYFQGKPFMKDKEL